MYTRSTLKIFFGVLFVFAFFGAGYFLEKEAKEFDPVRKITLGESIFRVEVSETSEERARGLSGLKSLPEGGGMLFVFPESSKPGIWMKEMLFPIDIVWLDKDGVVVWIVKNASPDSYPFVYEPEVEAFYVLEINAGVINARGIKIGDRAVFETGSF